MNADQLTAGPAERAVAVAAAIDAVNGLISEAEEFVVDAVAVRLALDADSPVAGADLDRLECSARSLAGHAPDVRWALNQSVTPQKVPGDG